MIELVDIIPIPDHSLLPDRNSPEFPWDNQPGIDDPILPGDPGDEPDDEKEESE